MWWVKALAGFARVLVSNLIAARFSGANCNACCNTSAIYAHRSGVIEVCYTLAHRSVA